MSWEVSILHPVIITVDWHTDISLPISGIFLFLILILVLFFLDYVILQPGSVSMFNY